MRKTPRSAGTRGRRRVERASARYVESTLAYYTRIGSRASWGVAEGLGRKIANGYENERGERTSIAIVSSTFARSPTRVVVNKRGDEEALLKRRTRFFSTSLSLSPSFLFYSPFFLCSFRGLLSRFDSLELLSLFNMCTFFFSEGLEKRLLLRERIARVGDGLWTDWSLCFVLFCIVRCGIRFFFLFPFVSTLLLFYATKEIVFFLRLIWNHSFILNFFAIDHPSILKILLRKFLQCQYPWVDMIYKRELHFFVSIFPFSYFHPKYILYTLDRFVSLQSY